MANVEGSLNCIAQDILHYTFYLVLSDLFTS